MRDEKKNEEKPTASPVFKEVRPPKPEPAKPAKPIKKPPVMIFYAGRFDRAGRTGAATGKEYSFMKCQNAQPMLVKVDAEDAPALLKEKGDGCFSHAPQRIFVTKEEHEEQLRKARESNK